MKRFVVLFALSLSLGFVTSAAVPPPEKLLPTDTLFVMTVPDMAKAGSIWKQSPSALLWNDAAMKPFKDKFLAKFKSDVIESLEKELGVKFADYTQLAQGQLTIAATQNGWDGRNDTAPAVLLLLDAREQRGLLQTNLAALKKKWVDAGKQLKTEKIRDIEFTTLLFSSEDLGKVFQKAFSEPGAADRLDDPKAKKVAGKQSLTFGQVDSLLIVGNVPKEIEKIVAHHSGGTVPSLIDHSAFAANHTALFRDCLGYGWVNLKTLVDNLTAGIKEKSGNQRGNDDLDPEKILTALGLKGMKTLAWNYRELSDGSMMNIHLGVPESGRKGLFKAFAFDAKEALPPPSVPASG